MSRFALEYYEGLIAKCSEITSVKLWKITGKITLETNKELSNAGT